MQDPYKSLREDFVKVQRHGYLVPFELSHIVCDCTEEEEQALPLNVTPMPTMPHLTMARCGRYPRYMVRRCVVCGTPFVTAFDYPAKCIRKPRCWDCAGDAWTEDVCDHEICKPHHQVIYPRPEDLLPRKKVTADSITFDDPDSLFDF